jgi:hypothetical protein
MGSSSARPNQTFSRCPYRAAVSDNSLLRQPPQPRACGCWQRRPARARPPKQHFPRAADKWSCTSSRPPTRSASTPRRFRILPAHGGSADILRRTPGTVVSIERADGIEAVTNSGGAGGEQPKLVSGHGRQGRRLPQPIRYFYLVSPAASSHWSGAATGRALAMRNNPGECSMMANVSSGIGQRSTHGRSTSIYLEGKESPSESGNPAQKFDEAAQ